MFNIILIDDNADCIKDLHNKIEKIYKDGVKIFEYTNEKDLLDALQSGSEYDAVITDIELNENSGIELGKSINRLYPEMAVIFVTGYAKYHQQVYDVRHMYFLEKPVDTGYLKKAIDRAMTNKQKNFIVLSLRGTQNKIYLNKIAFFESRLRSTVVVFSDGTQEIYPVKLKDITEKLPETFIAVHQSYVVNFDNIQKIERTNLTFCDGIQVPISRRYVTEVHNKLSKLLSEVSL